MTHPYLSGHCGTGGHDHCRGSYGTEKAPATCTCDCHRDRDTERT